MIRGADGRFKPVSWRDALAVIAEITHQVKPEEIVGIAGQLSDAESMIALKDFLNKLGSNNVWCEKNGMFADADLRSGYLMNTSIAELEKADVFLLVGTQVVQTSIILTLQGAWSNGSLFHAFFVLSNGRKNCVLSVVLY